jgi:hypothetical protein
LTTSGLRGSPAAQRSPNRRGIDVSRNCTPECVSSSPYLRINMPANGSRPMGQRARDPCRLSRENIGLDSSVEAVPVR